MDILETDEFPFEIGDKVKSLLDEKKSGKILKIFEGTIEVIPKDAPETTLTLEKAEVALDGDLIYFILINKRQINKRIAVLTKYFQSIHSIREHQNEFYLAYHSITDRVHGISSEISKLSRSRKAKEKKYREEMMVGRASNYELKNNEQREAWLKDHLKDDDFTIETLNNYHEYLTSTSKICSHMIYGIEVRYNLEKV